MTDVVAFPDPAAVGIPGLCFRHAAGPADASGWLAVHTGRAAHDGVDPLSTSERIPTLDEVARNLEALAEAGRLDRTIVAEAGGRVLGYNRLGDWRERDGTHVYLSLGWVLPEWRGRGLGSALLGWSEARSRQLAAVEHPGTRLEFAANASSTERDATALLLHHGYRPGYTVIEMGLNWEAFEVTNRGLGLDLPPGLTLRPVSPADFPRIAASVAEAYAGEYPGGRFQEVSSGEGFEGVLSDAGAHADLWQVAWDGDEVAGQVIIEFQRGRAEISEVSVRPAYRRRGLARVLLTRALLALRGRDVEVVRLRTVAEFPTRAIDLYRRLGFRTLKQFPRYRKAASA